MLRRKLRLGHQRENVGIVNGSQIAAFYLLNMFSGTFSDGRRRKILLPVVPEYIGYADQGIEGDCFTGRSRASRCRASALSKYRVDFDSLAIDDSIGAICVSRPTNPRAMSSPTGKVRKLLPRRRAGHSAHPRQCLRPALPGHHLPRRPADLERGHRPVHEPVQDRASRASDRDRHSPEELVAALSATNAIVSLATGSLGPAIRRESPSLGKLLELSSEVVAPYYAAKSSARSR